MTDATNPTPDAGQMVQSDAERELPRTLAELHKRTLDQRGRPVKSLQLRWWENEECPNAELQRVIDATRRRITGCFAPNRRVPARLIALTASAEGEG